MSVVTITSFDLGRSDVVEYFKHSIVRAIGESEQSGEHSESLEQKELAKGIILRIVGVGDQDKDEADLNKVDALDQLLKIFLVIAKNPDDYSKIKEIHFSGCGRNAIYLCLTILPILCANTLVLKDILSRFDDSADIQDLQDVALARGIKIIFKGRPLLPENVEIPWNLKAAGVNVEEQLETKIPHDLIQFIGERHEATFRDIEENPGKYATAKMVELRYCDAGVLAEILKLIQEQKLRAIKTLILLDLVEPLDLSTEVQDLQDVALAHGIKIIFREELASWNADLPENLQAGGVAVEVIKESITVTSTSVSHSTNLEAKQASTLSSPAVAAEESLGEEPLTIAGFDVKNFHLGGSDDFSKPLSFNFSSNPLKLIDAEANGKSAAPAFGLSPEDEFPNDSTAVVATLPALSSAFSLSYQPDPVVPKNVEANDESAVQACSFSSEDESSDSVMLDAAALPASGTSFSFGSLTNFSAQRNMGAGGSSPLYGFLNGNGSNANRAPAAGFQNQWRTYEPPADSGAHLLDDVQMDDATDLGRSSYTKRPGVP